MRKEITLSNALVIAALAATSACERYTQTLPTPQPTKPNVFVPTEVPVSAALPAIPTESPEAINTPTATIPEWQKSLDVRFSLGSFDPSKVSFKLDSTPDLLRVMNFIDPERTKEFDVKPALRVLTDFIPFDADGSVGTAFAKSAEKDGGTTPLVFLTDQPNILVLYAHSESITAPGEIARMIGSSVRKNPDKQAEMQGKQLIFKTAQGDIKGTIMMVTHFTESQFDDVLSPDSFWGVYQDRDNIIFMRTDKAGIPEAVRTDKTHKYIIFISCMPKDGDPINLNPLDPNRARFNTAERAVVILQLDNQ